jgi:Ca2+-binding EF-hand superfamily protein
MQQQTSSSSSSSSTLNDVFSALDEDENGSVSKSEFQTFLSDSDNGLADSVMGSGMDTGGLLGLFGDAARLDSATGSTASTDQLFSKMDTSGDGTISEDEMTTFASSMGSGESDSISSSLDDLFGSIDTNGDGSISSDEFDEFASNIGETRSAPPPPPPPSSADSTDSISSLDSLLESLGIAGSTDGSTSTSSSSTDSDQTASANAFAAIIMEAIGKYMQFGLSSYGGASSLDVTG